MITEPPTPPGVLILSRNKKTTINSVLKTDYDHSVAGEEIEIDEATIGFVVCNSGPSKTPSSPSFILVIVPNGVGWDYDDDYWDVIV